MRLIAAAMMALIPVFMLRISRVVSDH